MKKGIIVLLIMVMVAGFAFADATPTFSGEIKAGYTLYMGGDAKAYEWGDYGKELKLTLNFVGDYWKINVKGLNGGQLDSKGALSANVTMDIDKLVNMGDFKLALNAGNNSNTEILSSFNDWKGDEYYKLKIANAGDKGATASGDKATAKITAAYKAVKFQFAMDPTYAADNFGGAYSVSAQAAINDGINVSVGYVYNALTTAIGKDTEGKSKAVKLNWYARNAIGASFSVDIAKLAAMDGKFKISFYDNILLGLNLVNNKEKNGNGNALSVNVEGGYDKLTADLEFRASNGTYKGEKLGDYGLRAKAKYAFNDNWGAFIKGGLDSFDFTGDALSYGCWDLGGGVNFKIFNVDFGWQSYSNAYRTYSGSDKKGEFTIQPYFDLKF